LRAIDRQAPEIIDPAKAARGFGWPAARHCLPAVQQRTQASKIFTTKDAKNHEGARRTKPTMALRAERFSIWLPRRLARTRPFRLILFVFLRAASWFFVFFVVKSGAAAHFDLANETSSVTRTDTHSPTNRQGHKEKPGHDGIAQRRPDRRGYFLALLILQMELAAQYIRLINEPGTDIF
jgi:hypothetical protein